MKAIVRDIAFTVLLMAIGTAATYLSMGPVEIEAAVWKATTAIKNSELIGVAGLGRSSRTTLELNKQQLSRFVSRSKNAAAFPFSQEQPTGCDHATALLDHAVIDTRKLEGTYLIILARLGTGEKSRGLNPHRLAIVEEYVLRRRTDLKYVLAEGQKVNGLGRIELYVGGRLLNVTRFKKNALGYCLAGREGY